MAQFGHFPACLPELMRKNLSWSNVAGSQAFEEWHPAQSVPKPAAT
jgi:hypothetical protein